ncbi:hypothetical protein FKM82_005740 [Ascaphus truei]
MEDTELPSGLLEICVLVGAPGDKIREIDKIAQKGIRSLQSVEPEILSVFVPPFILKEETQNTSTNNNFHRALKRRSFRKKKEKPKAENVPGSNTSQKEAATEDISVPKDVDLIGLPQLCFPGGLHVTLEPKEEHFHFLVFTDVCGNRTYGVVAQYYRSVQDGGGLSNGQVYWDSSVCTTKACGSFIPFALCVISRYPYYNAFKDCLSCLLVQLKSCKDIDIDDRVKEFSAKLSLIPSPPPGPLNLVLIMKPLQIVFPSREDPDSPIIDLDLHLPFLCFTPKQVLQIMSCILTEQKIVFFSSDWALLTLIAECFMMYLHPIQWQHTFVPILSRQMLDFVMAPTSFLMGCHLDHFEEVNKEAEDLVLISIDSGNISYSKAGKEEQEVPDIPVEAAETFILRVESLQLHYDLELSHLRSVTDMADARMRRKLWQQNLNWEVQEIALQLIVDIFRDVKSHLNYEHRVFNSEEFLKTRAPGDQPFYKMVLEAYTFHSFLKARLNKRMDAFARMELNSQSETDGRLSALFDSPRRRPTEKMTRFRPEHMFSKKLVISLPNLQEVKMTEAPARQLSLRRADEDNGLKIPMKSVCTVKLPEIHFPLVSRCVQTYYTELNNNLSKEINCLPPEHSALLARYFYLRGLVYLMQGKLLNALLDFQNLYKTDIRIFPIELVKKVVLSLPPAEREQADRRPELKRLISQVMEKEREVTRVDDHVKNFELPKKHMQLNDFVKRIQESGIVTDIDTIHRLFDALTVGHQKQVDPDTFRDFYNYWKETEAEAEEVNLPSIVTERLDTNEFVYKLSSSVKTNYGVGKIAMTQKRLFLLTEGRFGYVEIATFRNIEDVKNTTVAFLVLRIPTLRIKTATRKEVFEANLKSECDLWHLMIKEMWAGRKMADNHKDPQYIQEALTNVLLMDAVVGSLQTSKAIYAASKLSHFDKMKNEVPMMVPKTTSETLKHRINPSAGETISQSVDVLLYTPGQLDASERDDFPKLWCALREGKVVVFNASTWSIQQHCFKVGNAKLRCMVGVEQSQVWIGSSDSTIYIINTHSMSCNKQLTDHRCEVVDIVAEDSNRQRSLSYSCSVDGTVFAWDINTLKIHHKFQLQCQNITSMKIHNDMLWCCSRDCIAVTKKNGQLLQKLQHTENLTKTGSFFNCIQLFPEKGQLWATYRGSNEVCILEMNDFSKPHHKIVLQDCTEISCMLKVKNQVKF